MRHGAWSRVYKVRLLSGVATAGALLGVGEANGEPGRNRTFNPQIARRPFAFHTTVIGSPFEFLNK